MSLSRLLVILAVFLSPTLANAQEEANDSETESADTEPEGSANEASSEAAFPAKDAKSTADKDAGDEAEAAAGEAYGHMGQWGLRAGLVGGMHVIFRYDENDHGSPFCTKPDPTKPGHEQRNNCGFVSPLATEFALSFAPLDSVEPYIYTRLGFTGEDETDTDPLTMFGVGVRLYTMSESAFKIFVEPGIAWETEGGGDNPEWTRPGYENEYKKDVVFHFGIGPHYDFSKNVGMFLNASLDVGILRAIHAYMLLNLGVQGRLP